MNNSKPNSTRYNDVAVILHWLIALLLIGLLAMGKYMHILDDDNPQKFMLVQLHKSFGIVALMLVIIRLVWRTTYTPPAHPAAAPKWEKIAARLTHVALYILMLALPLSGWLMVSASPLNLDTILFNAINWPHVPGAAILQEKELAGVFHQIHEIAGGALILLILMHVGAALKHHLINHDDVLRRMAPNWQSATFKPKLAATVVSIALFAAGLALLASAKQPPAIVVTANNSSIGFNTKVAGEATPGQFNESTISLTLDDNDLPSSILTAEVNTSSVFTDNYQVNGSLPEADWLDSKQHPVAMFQSDEISSDDGQYLVKGSMTIKGISNRVEFPLVIQEVDGKQQASGSFNINRQDYDLGTNEQPDEEYVANDITIEFRFDI